MFSIFKGIYYSSRFNLVAFEAFDEVVAVAWAVPLFPQSGTFNKSPILIKSGFLTWGLTATKLCNVISNFSFAMMIMVSPATTLVVGAVPLEHAAVGFASGAAAGATHAGDGIPIISPMFMRRELVIWGFTNCSCASVVFADVAIFARVSPAVTVWLDMMLQLVPTAAVVSAPWMGIKDTVVRRNWNYILDISIA